MTSRLFANECSPSMAASTRARYASFDSPVPTAGGRVALTRRGRKRRRAAPRERRIRDRIRSEAEPARMGLALAPLELVEIGELAWKQAHGQAARISFTRLRKLLPEVRRALGDLLRSGADDNDRCRAVSG